MTRLNLPRLVLGLIVPTLLSACVARPVVPVAGAPRFPDFPTPEVPATLTVSAALRDDHFDAWRRLQSGDLQSARAAFGEVLTQMPEFYPAQAGLGYVELAAGEPQAAADRFAAAATANPQYLPAWIGQAEAALSLELDAEAIVAMERILELDPAREALRPRLELVRFRHVQSLIDAGRHARAEGRLDDARQILSEALARSPASTVILHELALVASESGQAEAAEQYLRRAIALEPHDPQWEANLGQVLEAQERYADASAAYARAAALDPRTEWRTRSAELRRRAEMAALPPEFGSLADATAVTRAQAATLIGIRLDSLLRSAPPRALDVATDVRTHWAAPWILPVTRAGIIPVFPNHTFQPDAVLFRGDLAALSVALLHLAAVERPAELAAWQAARPRFEDLPAGHVRYPAGALAVAAGIMDVSAGGRFEPTAPATGADLEAAVRRIETLASR